MNEEEISFEVQATVQQGNGWVKAAQIVAEKRGLDVQYVLALVERATRPA